MENKKIGLIAGKGRIPAVLAQSMKKNGLEITAITTDKDANAELKEYTDKVYNFAPTQIGKIISKLKDEKIKEVVMVGKVEKALLYKNLRFDLRSIKLLSRLKDRQDATILLAIVDELAGEGIEVLPQTKYLSHLLFPPGTLTKRKPNENEKEDILFGMRIVEKIAESDISQTVIVKNKAILAIEAIEGTTEAIRRGMSMAKDAVVIKTSKKNQDHRFDIATVGTETVKVMIEGKAGCLAIKAGRTFLVDKEETVKMADKAGISIVVAE
ncbi:MAG: UDP-2,3-diacylglucosamine diphosphatase LpxI [bacterium]